MSKSNLIQRMAVMLVVAAVAVFGVVGLVGGPVLADAPAPGTIVGISTRTFLNAKVLSDTVGGAVAITYTAQPLNVQGTNIARTVSWYQADVFVTAAVGVTSSVNVTVQASADGTNWADTVYSTSLSANGTNLLQFGLAGEYTRFAIGYDGQVTLTIKSTFKNTAK